MYVGQRGSKGEVYRRCPSCEESKNPSHCHWANYPDGSTYCFRCGFSSQLSLDALMAIANGDCTIDEALEGDWEPPVIRGKTKGRFSALPKFCPVDCPEADTFEMRTCNGRVTGYYHRYPGKRSIVEGKAGIGFVGDRLVSSPSSLLIVTEGPYDVLTERHACVFGTLSKGRLRHFRLQWCYLWPDPDWVDTAEKRDSFVEKAVKPALEMPVFIQGIILSDADPDEATKIEHVPIVEALNW